MIRATVLIASLSLLGGCGFASMMKTHDVASRYDASTGTSTALVGGGEGEPFHPTCSILRDAGSYRELVIDAGSAFLQVDCHRGSGVFGQKKELLGRANIAFEAHAGHTYRIVAREDFGFPHVDVVDVEKNEQVIQRSLLDSRYSTVRSTAIVTLVSRSGSGVISCKFTKPWDDRRVTSIVRRPESFVSQPYSHQITAECSTYAYLTGDVKERYEAPVNFVPVAGRLYTVHMDERDPEFLFVTDVSSDIQTIDYVRTVKTY
jgi:hypothetical protein